MQRNAKDHGFFDKLKLKTRLIELRRSYYSVNELILNNLEKIKALFEFILRAKLPRTY